MAQSILNIKGASFIEYSGNFSLHKLLEQLTYLENTEGLLEHTYASLEDGVEKDDKHRLPISIQRYIRSKRLIPPKAQ